MTSDVRKPTQAEQIRAHLEREGSISTIEASELYGCLRLGARIHTMRDSGIAIRTEYEEAGDGKFVARYHLGSAEAAS